MKVYAMIDHRPRGPLDSLIRLNLGGLPRGSSPAAILHSAAFRQASILRAERMGLPGSRQQILAYARHALRLLFSGLLRE